MATFGVKNTQIYRSWCSFLVLVGLFDTGSCRSIVMIDTGCHPIDTCL